MKKSRKPSGDLAGELDLADQQGDLLRRITTLEQQLDSEKRQRKLADARTRTLQDSLAAYEVQDEVLRQLDERQIRGSARVRGKLIKGDSTAVLCCNDWHAEECVDPRTVNGLNEFNLDICTARINRLWDKALELLEFTRGFTTIKQLVVWLGGDMIAGAIHEELLEGNFLQPADAIEFVEQHICDGLETLRKHAAMERILVLCSHGNHGRTTAKPRVATSAGNSWEYLAYRHLQRLYERAADVDVAVSRGYHLLADIQGLKVRFHHGDGIRYQGGVGGLTIPMNKAIAQWNKSSVADYDVSGHFHAYHEDWRWTSCGCLVGYGAYALRIKAEYQPPTQTLLVFNRRFGKILSMPIFVADPNESEWAANCNKRAKVAR